MKTRLKAGDKVRVVTLGCAKNIVDSEKLMAQLTANSLEVIYNENPGEARTVIINTCGFINDAKEESINTILNYVKAKNNGQYDYVYVMGCLSQRYSEELRHEIPDIDQFFGVNNFQQIIKTLGTDYKQNLVGERILTTPSHYAYLKIAEGCDRH